MKVRLLGARDVVRGAAMEVAPGRFCWFSSIQLPRGQALLDQAILFGFAATAPHDLIGTAKPGDLVGPLLDGRWAPSSQSKGGIVARQPYTFMGVSHHPAGARPLQVHSGGHAPSNKGDDP